MKVEADALLKRRLGRGRIYGPGSAINAAGKRFSQAVVGTACSSLCRSKFLIFADKVSSASIKSESWIPR